MSKKKRKVSQKYSSDTKEYTIIYSDEQRKNDENKVKNGYDFSAYKRLIISDIMNKSQILETQKIGKYNMATIHNMLNHPSTYWKDLIYLSKFLMQFSPYYMRLNNLFANMALFQWGLDIYDVFTPTDSKLQQTLKTRYLYVASQLEKMNLKHEFAKIMRVLPYQDIFFGLVYEDKNDFFIQEIPYQNCEIYQIQDGLYNFKIDLLKIKRDSLLSYPDYVQQAYLDFIDGKNQFPQRWYIPPSDKQICIKFNQHYSYPFPILIGMLNDVLDLEIYKKLKLQSARTDNYKAILMEIPIDKNTPDKPLLSAEAIGVFSELNNGNLPDDVGVIYALGEKGQAISFKDSSNSRNNVEDAVNNLYTTSGMPKEIFNGSSNATPVKYGVENTAGYVYFCYRQFERWVNRYIKVKKYNKKSFKFKFYILDTTIFNRDDVTKRYREAATVGLTVVDKYLASIDMNPSVVMGSFILHQNIFEYEKNAVHLTSTFNSSEQQTGRPTNESKGEVLDVTGEQTAENEENQGR